MRYVSVVCLSVMFAACGGGGGSSPTPTAPAPTVSSISMQIADVLLVGRSSTATATATLSNGQSQTVTSGWQSSAAHVASVTDAGLVRGVGNGTSAISISSGGQQASRTIRIAPDYDGRWDGVQVVTACRDSGDLLGICNEPVFDGVVGSAYPISLTARQPGALDVSGEFVVEQIAFPTFTTAVEENGGIRFSSDATDVEFRASVRWVMQSTLADRGDGTIVETYSFPGLAVGELVWESSFSNLQKGTVRTQTVRVPSTRRAGLLERVRASIRR